MDLKQFFDAVVGGRVELRAILPDRKGIAGRLFGGDEDQQRQFIKQYNGKANIFFGVLPRPLPDEVGVYWADLDFKHYESEEAARGTLAAFTPKPHIVVGTGGGLHAYWLVDPPISAGMVKPTLRALAEKLGSDPTVAERARVLRVPDTVNPKYDPPRECKIEFVADCLFPYHPLDFNLDITEREEDLTKKEKPADYQRSEASYLKAVSYAQDFEPSIENQQGNNNAYLLSAAMVKDHGLSVDEAIEVMMTHWNPRCVPPWNEGELREIVEHADAYAKGTVGGEDPAADFKDVADEAPPQTKDDYEKLDEKYHVVDDGGQARIYYESTDAFGPCWNNCSVREFHDLISTINLDQQVVKVKNRGIVRKSALWLESKRPGKKVYTGATFNPANDQDPSVFNLWTGMIEPKEGDLTQFFELVFDILSAGDQKVFDYIMDWCALAVQRPWEKPGTAIVFRGIEGNGKSFFGSMLYKIFQRHGTRVDRPDHFTGKFNAHFRDKVFVFVDEAFWSGDTKHEGIIKSMVTDDFIISEAKFKNAIPTKSYLHVMMASNNDHVIKIKGPDARRFVIFGVETKKSPEFYADLVAQKSRIPAAWLHYLLNRNIEKFEPYAARPLTDAYETQQDLSDPMRTWLKTFIENDYEDAMVPAVKPRIFRKEDLRNSYLRYLKEIGESPKGGRGIETMIGRELQKCLRTVREARISLDGKQDRCYIFPSLEEARKALNIEEVKEYDPSEELI